MLAKFLLRTPENQTVAVGLQTFISDVTNQRVSFAAGAILIALPICLLFFFYKELCYRPDIWRNKRIGAEYHANISVKLFSALRTPTQVFAGRKLLSWPKFS